MADEHEDASRQVVQRLCWRLRVRSPLT